MHQVVPYINENHEWLTQLEEVYSYRKSPATKQREILINWKRLPPYEATWEDCNDFKQQFHDFHHEDKVDLEEESRVRPSLLFKYGRRNKNKVAHENEERNKEEGGYSGGTNS